MLLALLIVLFQRALIYFPTRNTPDPVSLGLNNVQTIGLETPDGETLEIWYAPATGDAATVLYLHGNAGNIAGRAQRLVDFNWAGLGVILLSWPGYGNSTGSPSESGLMIDAQTGYDWLIGQGISPDQIVILGESLGTGPAVKLAARNETAALLLGAPYTAIVDLAADQFPWLPVPWLMLDQYRSRDHIAAVTAPIHITHGTADRVIPYTHGQSLANAATAPVTFRTIDRRGHDIIIDRATTQHEIAFLRGLGLVD